MTTKLQIAANRENGRKGGPKTDAGKAVSRMNARKHGIFVSAFTHYDDLGLVELYDELAEWLEPAGPVETMLTEAIALNYLRLQRCVRAEAEYHARTWEEKRKGARYTEMVDAATRGEHASWFNAEKFQEAVALFGRYNTTITNQLVKLLHELERAQRMRSGEGAPPPLAADVAVTSDVAPANEDAGAASTDGEDAPLRNEPNLSEGISEDSVTANATEEAESTEG